MRNTEVITRKALAFTAFVVSTLGSSALAQIPPDFYPDGDVGNFCFRKNSGQMLDTDGAVQEDIGYSAERSPLGIHLAAKSTVAFTWATVDQDTSTVDTLYRVDMGFEGAYERSPIPWSQVADLAHYYIGDLAAVEDVPAYHRAYYEDVWDRIDVHFHHGSTGPRMSYVIRPGGAPGDIELKFTGQDSIALDLLGNLNLYVDQKWITLPEAIAYQVNTNGSTTPLTWSASYEHDEGSVYVEFDFDGYDLSRSLIFEIGFPPMPAQGGGGDPEGNLTWSTSVGGDANDHVSDHIMGGDHMTDKDLIVTGTTDDPAFPAQVGTTFTPVLRDVFTSRFKYAPGDDELDAKLLWTTFAIGITQGPSGELSGYEVPTCIKYVPDHDLIYVGGWTNSTMWPMIPDINPNDGSYYQSVRKGQRDAFILQLFPDGTLNRSTFYGGNGDDIITTIAHDFTLGRVYCFGVTNSTTGSYNSCNSPTSGLPLCNPATGNLQQNNNAGGLDMFVARFDEDFNLTWGSFIGGPGDDRVFDSDQLLGPNEEVEIALAGSATSSLPYVAGGDFQLNSSGGPSGPTGFVWLFNGDGAKGWGTHIHRTVDLQAVSFGKNCVRVMGLTTFSSEVNAQATCDAVPGALSICGGTGEPYYRDHYIAEFGMVSKNLKWSDLVGGPTDGSAEAAVDRYTQTLDVLHGMYRLMDLRSNGEDHFMVMGIVAQLGEGPFPTLPAFGMYYKPFNTDMGDQQSEIFVTLYDPEHLVLWSTMFGSEFDAIDPFTDWDLRPRGSDFGTDIVWVDQEVLYLVGTTGGYQMHRECPYPFPGPSYCELTAGPLSFAVDEYDGMIVRFDLRDLQVGVNEGGHADENALQVYPSPTADLLYVSGPAAFDSKCEVWILDPTGRLVSRTRYMRSGPVDVSNLASGNYQVIVKDRSTRRAVMGRFIRL